VPPLLPHPSRQNFAGVETKASQQAETINQSSFSEEKPEAKRL
jgi:hypothetical protein